MPDLQKVCSRQIDSCYLHYLVWSCGLVLLPQFYSMNKVSCCVQRCLIKFFEKRQYWNFFMTCIPKIEGNSMMKLPRRLLAKLYWQGWLSVIEIKFNNLNYLEQLVTILRFQTKHLPRFMQRVRNGYPQIKIQNDRYGRDYGT